NDYVGYRPLAMLENRRCHPYGHEFVRPIPMYIAGAGVSSGTYRELIDAALTILRQTDPGLLRSAAFDPDRMKELALDPRAYDFDHPVNRRPNYHFGGWDDRSVDGDGHYSRFVLRQVTLDCLLSRLTDTDELDRDEMLVEAATVLAGTVLMASGITGSGPGSYTSEVTLASLMKPVATYRDEFYGDQLAKLTGQHADRLLHEQRARRQPFGAVRQHLNAALAQRRAAQLQHVQLARLYARMGYPDAATKQADAVRATSARMICRIDCAITLGLRALRARKLSDAVRIPHQGFDLLKRGIECGALMDPWDILGFGGTFSLFPGPESSIHDTRLDDLLYLVEQLFSYTARVWSEAAAQDDQAAYAEMEGCYQEMADWWRTFAAHTLDSIEAVDPYESFDSAKLVAQALRLWHRGGAASGDVAFWAPHADLFDSPRAYALVISALLERRDFVAAMALLIHWLGNADRVGLRSGGSSLPRLIERWLLRVRDTVESKDAGHKADTSAVWPMVRKFFDFLEANAQGYWSAPRFLLGRDDRGHRDWDQELAAAESGQSPDDSEGLYDAAYEGMSYQDTTDDGNEGAVFDPGTDDGSQDELEAETRRLSDHLSFLQSLARTWAVAADLAIGTDDQSLLDERFETLKGWADRAKENRIGLLELLDSVRSYRVATGGSDKDSMRSYDRRRVLRDSLMEQIITTAVEMSNSRRLICGTLVAMQPDRADVVDEEMTEDDAGAIELYATLIAGDIEQARATFAEFLDALTNKNLLYIPISRGGDPVKIYIARLRQRILRHLMLWLPRRGMIAEACRLIETARRMEQSNTIGVGAVTEFDGLFREGFRAMVSSIVDSCQPRSGVTTPSQPDPTDSSADTASASQSASSTDADQPDTSRSRSLMQDDGSSDRIIPLLEELTETLLASWLSHSQTLRLSPLESVTDPAKW
ncbi:MAG: hypothetical protein AAGA03_16995, partial [Planctomycetota bacterium]